jgi:hypothetical protein
MPTQLRNLKIARVDLVTEGASQGDGVGAHVVLFKRAGTEDYMSFDHIANQIINDAIASIRKSGDATPSPHGGSLSDRACWAIDRLAEQLVTKSAEKMTIEKARVRVMELYPELYEIHVHDDRRAMLTEP